MLTFADGAQRYGGRSEARQQDPKPVLGGNLHCDRRALLAPQRLDPGRHLSDLRDHLGDAAGALQVAGDLQVDRLVGEASGQPLGLALADRIRQHLDLHMEVALMVPVGLAMADGNQSCPAGVVGNAIRQAHGNTLTTLSPGLPTPPPTPDPDPPASRLCARCLRTAAPCLR